MEGEKMDDKGREGKEEQRKELNTKREEGIGKEEKEKKKKESGRYRKGD